MDLAYLEQIIKLFEESTLTELEIDEEGSRVTLGRAKEQQQAFFGMPSMPSYGMPQMQQAAPAQNGAAPATGGATQAASPGSSAKTHEVKSPIVGTFYRAPAPDADSYIQ